MLLRCWGGGRDGSAPRDARQDKVAPAVEVFSTVSHSIGSDVSVQDEIGPFYFIVLNACHFPGDNKKS